MFKNISAAVILILVWGGITVSASKNQQTPKAAVAHHHDATQHNCAACHRLTKEQAQELLKEFGQVKEVKLAPVKGLYEVTLKQGEQQMAAYIDFGKRLLLAGRVYTIADRKMISPLPTKVPVHLTKTQLDQLRRDDSIVMGNGNQRLFVFTDPDCPYCKRLHGELKKLVSLEPDLSIYIKMNPLKMHPGAYNKARVILAANSLDMLEKAFAGEKLPSAGEKDLKKPIDETIALATSLGIRGAPAMVFPHGELIIGFRKAEEMQALLKPPRSEDAKQGAAEKTAPN